MSAAATTALAARRAWDERAAQVQASAPGPVPSPCVNVCRMVASTGWCEGCWRSIDEIAAWSRLDDAARRVVWQQLMARRGQATP